MSDPGCTDAGDKSAFEQFLESVPDAIVGVALDGRIAFANGQAERLFGYPREALLGETLELLIPQRFRDSHPGHRSGYFERPRTRPMGAGLELFAQRRDGTEFPAEISLSTIELNGETIATAAVRDVSERAESEREKALQRQLDRARRLESVGQLAGGVAHDFNNILAVIMNYAEFVAGEVEPESRAHEDAEEIRRAAERAAALTRQLLIFSRREVANPEVLLVRDVLEEVEKLLRRALGEHIELEMRLGESSAPVEIDPGQLEQVLVSLAVNARDAMPAGGRLVIEVERVFEPFFTTKDEGTGLGLATVYGIVTGAGGRIDIYSEPGVGTTVKVHLPEAANAPAAEGEAGAERREGNGEVVLVVEDESEVRRMAERILLKGGYVVIGHARGGDALAACADPAQPIDLLLTDVIMPEMLGTELVAALQRRRPGVKVVYMSGYSHEVLTPSSLLDEGRCAFIEKPFSSAELLETVGDLLADD